MYVKYLFDPMETVTSRALTDKQTNRQTDRQTDIQTKRPTYFRKRKFSKVTNKTTNILPKTEFSKVMKSLRE